ncbi:DedA family protein [Streptomyces sp. NBC_01262]|uniref:DedA family protein n=1 Tax=Streptomyces sp. NBC_01262 TaxID=2903803 RepID=UPI002E34DB9F|nr:DedA family protein [Streptomyces sp. NBC_01262]
MAEPLPGPLAHLAPLLEDYGYLAVGTLVLLDNGGIPVPGQTILVAAAVYAGTGRLNFPAVLAVAVAAAVIGNALGYLIGRKGGRAFVHRWGRYVLLTPARLERAEEFFVRHGAAVITWARFVDVLRQTNGIIAGTVGMPWRRFMVFNVIGAALWVGVWAGLGYAAGAHIGTIYAAVARSQLLALAVLGALAAVLLARHLLRRR